MGLGAADRRRLIHRPPSELHAVSGSNVSLECVTDGGSPRPGVTWRRQDGTPIAHDRHQIMPGLQRHARLS